MPTATAVFGATLVNLGPLTTTFTLPTSCDSKTDARLVADATNINNVYGLLSCASHPIDGGCYPSGDKLASVWTQWVERPPSQGNVFYFSPGVVCPEGWTTAGSAVNDGTTTSLAGVFTEEPYTDITGIDAYGLPAKSMYLEALDPSETLVFCCPSDYVPWVNGGCHSKVGPLTQTSMCLYPEIPPDDIVTITSYDGSSWSPALISVTDKGKGPYVTGTFPLDAGEISQYVVVTEALAVALIHKASDAANSGSEGTGSAGNGATDTSTSSSTSTSTKNAAGSGPGPVDKMMLIPLVAVVVSTMLGWALLIPL
ncbi:hypothetical protein BX600DRAFT_457143 [Xylariales sp. PMI_506]|nr:hypothetical protein BX600DRAFT_457143 [Xylariales sp. PMI_506]